MKIQLKNGKHLTTIPVNDFLFHSEQQEKKCEQEFCVEAFDFRYTFSLPMYIEKEFFNVGLTPVLLGYTTYQSSTWGLKKFDDRIRAAPDTRRDEVKQCRLKKSNQKSLKQNGPKLTNKA